VIKLFENTKYKEKLGLFSALFFAVSPWSINLSRVATENVIVVYFLSLGVWLYSVWIQKEKNYYFFFSFACFLVALFTYQAPRSFLPLFLPILFITFYKQNKKKLLLSFVAYVLVIIIPVILILVSPTLSFRIRTLSIQGNPATQLVLDEQLREDGVAKLPSFEARLFHNKFIGFSSTFLHNYAEHFSFDFLFTDSGLPIRYKVPGMGLLYFIDVPFIIYGAWSIFRKNKRVGLLLSSWVLLAPIGSALTFDDIPNLQRTFMVFPALSIISAFGFFTILETIKLKIRDKRIVSAIYAGLTLIIVYCVAFYLHAYYVHQVFHRPWYRNEGYPSLVEDLNKYSNDYKKVVITENQGAPATFIFFYNRLSPSYVQNVIVKNTKGDDYGNVSFGKYLMTSDGCPVREYQNTDVKTGLTETKLVGEHGVLYVNDGQCKIPKSGVKLLDTVKRKDSTSAFEVLTIE